MEDIKVTVCCLTHNLEKYVRQAIEGFVMQKTSFKYEVLIHDDASTDRTPDIIREYTEKYPDLIKPIYQKENMHKQHINIAKDILFPMAKGKYIAVCDGDDYWTDENKLQKQYDALEKHKNCSICVHRNKMIKDDDELYEDFIPSKESYKWKTGVIKQQDILKCLVNYPFQTACYFFRKENMKPFIEGKLFNYYIFADQIVLYMSAVNGDFYFFDSDMAVYRMNCPNCASMKIRNDTSHFKNFVDKKIKIIESINRYTEYKFDDYFKRDIDVMRFRLRSVLERRNSKKDKVKMDF